MRETPADLSAQEPLIRACVRRFYSAARTDDLIGPIFEKAVKDWDRHLAVMDDFWSGALLGTQRYEGAPFPPHLALKMGQEHFDRWRDLWIDAAEAELPEPLCGRAVGMGANMAHCWGRAHVSLSEGKALA